MGKARKYCYKEGIPFGAMFAVECTNVGLSTIFKAATLKGLSYHVFMVYSYGVSALTLLPLCFIFYRFTGQLLFYKGIEYSSPALSSAMSTITPAATFILALLLRMEKLEMKNLRSQLKSVGTLLTIAGAIIVVLYKGPMLINTHSSSLMSSVLAPPDTSRSDWITGGVLCATNYLIMAIWYIFQAKVINEYPAELMVVFFLNLFLCIIATPVCLISEPNLSAWALKPDTRLFSCLASGIIGTGLGSIIHTWGVHVKGATYVTLFKPFSIPIAAIFGVLFLDDNLYFGSIIGAFIISMGFYIVIWGKSQEEVVEVVDDTPAEDSNVPLLA